MFPLDHYTSGQTANMLRPILHKSPDEIHFGQVTFLNSSSAGDPVTHFISTTARITCPRFQRIAGSELTQMFCGRPRINLFVFV